MALQRFLKLAFWSAAVFALVMASLPRPPQLPGSPQDKIQHIVAFLTLAGLATAAYPRMPLLRVGFGLSAFGALIELIQTIPILHRDAEFADWAADTLAVAFVLLLVGLFRRRRQKA